jgi:enamine deaminase RidA (YjgF/YER057c/UK114 family)
MDGVCYNGQKKGDIKMKNISRHETSKRMSKAVVFNETAYLCGQVASERTKDVGEQTLSALGRIDKILSEIGTDRTRLLSATIYLKSMDDFARMNEVWEAWVPDGYAPARACVKADMAAEDILVEISIIAAM